ncbi:MAG: DUF2501 domain-containing protein [Delftia acidovorans]|jgi:hypothetical protein|nr:DUF2501 domain-containing protein [Delftia acidovorans]MDR3014798.1 DUF2501 domain-containing protein [Delftia acidovorans]
MKTSIASALLCALLGLGALPAQASGLGDSLRQASGLGGDKAASSEGAGSGLGGMLGAGAGGAGALSALGLSPSATAGNAAGVITYCMKNNYLNADKAAQVKDQLLGKLGMQKQEEPKDTGFQNGLGGLVTGSNGKSFSIDKLKGDLREKACDFVLDNAKSLI